MTATTDITSALLRRTFLAAAMSAIGLAIAAQAQAADSALVDFKVINRETGQAARVWQYAGRLFVAGQPGARYSVRITNNSPGRVLVVVSVDGVNILTGETAGFGQRGYVFAPYETYDVTGWRKSDSEVAAFTFAPLSRSYAARTGRPDDVGVIGIAAFTERYVAPVAAPEARDRGAADSVEETIVTGSRRAELAAPGPSAGKAAPYVQAPRQPEKLGTGHGAREWSSVTTVQFERATASPQLIRRIEYDSVENLVAIGAIPPTPPMPVRPRAFPATPDRYGYVPDPPGRG